MNGLADLLEDPMWDNVIVALKKIKSSGKTFTTVSTKQEDIEIHTYKTQFNKIESSISMRRESEEQCRKQRN